MIRLKILAIIAALAFLAACSNDVTVSTGDAPTPDATGDDIGIVSGLEVGERVVVQGANVVRLSARSAGAPAHGHVH